MLLALAVKADVLLDALAVKAELRMPVPDTGAYAEGLRAFLIGTFALGRANPVVDALRALMAQAQVGPEFGTRFRTVVLQARRDALGIVLDRAREHGDLPAIASPDTVADVVFGTIRHRLPATGMPLGERLADELVALLAPSVHLPEGAQV